MRRRSVCWSRLGSEALEEYELADPRVRVQVRYRKLVEVDEPADVEDAGEASESADEPSEGDTSVTRAHVHGRSLH